MDLKNFNNQNELIQKVSKGDEVAFKELFYTYKGVLYSFLLDLTKSESRAKDILQETFLKLWQRRSEAKGVKNIKAYIFTIAKNLIIDEVRKINRHKESGLQITSQADLPCTPEEEYELKEIQMAYQRALRQLPPQQQKIFQLSRESGMMLHEIARDMNLSLSTVQNHLFRATKKIREFLSAHRFMMLF